MLHAISIRILPKKITTSIQPSILQVKFADLATSNRIFAGIMCAYPEIRLANSRLPVIRSCAINQSIPKYKPYTRSGSGGRAQKMSGLFVRVNLFRDFCNMCILKTV